MLLFIMLFRLFVISAFKIEEEQYNSLALINKLEIDQPGSNERIGGLMLLSLNVKMERILTSERNLNSLFVAYSSPRQARCFPCYYRALCSLGE